MSDGGLLCADGEFALVFVAAEFALDGHMRAFGEGAFTQEEWDDIIDQILEEKREWTEDEDIDWEEIAESMRVRFEDFSSEIPEM